MRGSGHVLLRLRLKVADYGQLSTLLGKLDALPGVEEARRRLNGLCWRGEREPDNRPGDRVEPVADWLQEVEFRLPPATLHIPQGGSAVTGAGCGVGAGGGRCPAAITRAAVQLVWPDMRAQRLLDEAEAPGLRAAERRRRKGCARALRGGTGAGSGSLEARQGSPALPRPHRASPRPVRAKQFEEAHRSLALAQELAVPQAEADAGERTAPRESAMRDWTDWCAGPGGAGHRGDASRIAAVPARARLAAQQYHALEGREDTLAELLQGAPRIMPGGTGRGRDPDRSRVRSDDPAMSTCPMSGATCARRGSAASPAEADLRRSGRNRP